VEVRLRGVGAEEESRERLVVDGDVDLSVFAGQGDLGGQRDCRQQKHEREISHA
jgi:hypothetical protein